MGDRFVVVDGNEAAANVAYQASEVIAIYPITPASPMGELSDMWAAKEKANAWGTVPRVIQMQSEGGAAGAVHGSLATGALTTTFTASQGLLLMLPNMFKIAGELTPTVFHIAARTVATHALSIFGDHSDIMAARMTGWGFLASNSVQEAQDMALIATASTLETRVPFLHFFDGFRTSHEVNKISLLDPEEIRSFLDMEAIRQHRERALSPDRPTLHGSAQNPDVFFQAREAIQPFYDRTAGCVADVMNRFAERFGRRYGLFELVGDADAERVVVLMGSGAGAAEETVLRLCDQGERVALLKVRLYRPFDGKALVDAIPATAKSIAVLDRTKEPGAVGEPLYMDVVTALAETGASKWPSGLPHVTGGRYGLSSKEFTPAMVKGVLDQMGEDGGKNRFTVGIVDDVSHSHIRTADGFDTEPDDVIRAVFFGLGSDGTVGANKETVKIIGTETDLHAQGYFEYDSKKSGAVTVSHLRFGPRPIQSTYKISSAGFVACHQFSLLERMDVLGKARPGATFLLNCPYGSDEVWDALPSKVQLQIQEKKLRFFIIDAAKVAREVGLSRRINTVMQTCFFALADVLPRDEAIARIKDSIQKSYGKRGRSVVERNHAAVDSALAAMHELNVAELTSASSTPNQAASSTSATGSGSTNPASSNLAPSKLASTPNGTAGFVAASIPPEAPDFVQRVTARIIEGEGDLLPVSALPVDGGFPTGTARYEKRSIAEEIPIWDPEICIQCSLCALVCPHAAIRINAVPEAELAGAPDGFRRTDWKNRNVAGHQLAIQVAPDDCTGCGICADICPARSKEVAKHKALNMEPKSDHLDLERKSFEFFETLPYLDRSKHQPDFEAHSVKGSQFCEPLFEFSGACAGCGETPYLKLLSQLYGDRALIANATGCSSIYGGNLPTTPWTFNSEGRGPAWSNSLFEDNAEFGLGMRLAVDRQRIHAERLMESLRAHLPERLVDDLIGCRTEMQHDDATIAGQRDRVAQLKQKLSGIDDPRAAELLSLADVLVRRSVWIVGGDGWAYDIGFGGVDHILASGEDVNVLVLDTEVYSNTGGQASKSTQRGAVAKFAADGKSIGKKDLGMIAMAYGNVYVGQVVLGANPKQTVRVFAEAESYPGPSLIIAYSPCIAHGIDMSRSIDHQKEAVKSGYVSLYRFDPRLGHDHGHPFQLDSAKPSLPLKEFAMKEGRFAMLARSQPERAETLLEIAQREIDERRHYYEQLATVDREIVGDSAESQGE